MLWDEPKIFFLERRYFFSIILSEFLKNRVALQKALAVRLKLEGVELERDCISRIEIGTRFVADYEIKMIAKTLNVSVLWLLGIE